MAKQISRFSPEYNKHDDDENVVKNESTSSKQVSRFDPSREVADKPKDISEYGIDKKQLIAGNIMNANDAVKKTYSGWNSPEKLNEYRKTIQGAQQVLSTYGGKSRDVEELLNTYKQYMDNFDSISDVYGQYNTAEAFSSAARKASLAEQYKGLTYDQVQKQMKLRKEGTPDYEFFRDYTDYADLSEFDKALEAMGDVQKPKNYSQTFSGTMMDKKQKESGVREAYNRKQLLEQARNRYELDHRFDDYKSYQDADDYEAKSVADPAAMESDGLYRYINNRESDFVPEVTLNGPSVNKADEYFKESDFSQMSDEEIGMYNYLYATDPEKAREYLDRMTLTLNKRRSDAEMEALQGDINDNGKAYSAVMSAGSVPLNLVGGVMGTFDDVTRILSGQELNPYSYNKAALNTAQEIRQDVSQKIADNTSLEFMDRNVGQFVYNTFMSMVDSIAGGRSMGTTYSSIMGLSAQQNSYKELKEAGVSEGQARAVSCLAGLAEWFFEEKSLEAFLKDHGTDSFKAFLKNVVAQGGVEASEEVFTEIANMMSENMILGDTSDLMQQAESLRSRGFSDEDIMKAFSKQAIGQIVEAGIGGLLSGAGMGAFASAGEYRNNAKTGKDVNASALMDYAKGQDEESELYKLYTEYSGGKVTNAKAGNLYNKAINDAYERYDSTEYAPAKAKAANDISRLSEMYSKEYEAEDLTGENAVKPGEVIELKKVGGKTVAVTDKGEIPVSEIKSTKPYEKLISLVEKEGFTEEESKEILSMYNGKQNPELLVQGYKNVAEAGMENYGQEVAYQVKGALTVDQAKAVFEKNYQAKVAKEVEARDAAIKSSKPKYVEGSFDTSAIAMKRLTVDTQKQLEFVRGLQEMMAANVKITESVADENGDISIDQENGSYTPSTNVITIDINAHKSNIYSPFKAAILPTMIHETTHMSEALAPEEYNDYQNAVLSVLAKDARITIKQRIENEKAAILESDPKRTKPVEDKEAIGEIVARASEKISIDDIQKYLSEMSEEHRTGFINKMIDVCDRMIGWLKNELAFLKTRRYSEEAEFVSSMKDEYEEIKKKYVKMLVKAAEVNRQIDEEGRKVLNEYANVNSIMKQYNKGFRDKHLELLNTNYSTANASVSLQSLLDVYKEVDDMWTEIGKDLDSKFMKDWDNQVYKDRAFTVFKAQQGYKYNIELSSMCKKGIPLFEAIDTIVKKEVMSKLDTKVIGMREKQILYDLLKQKGFEIPCAICYVEQARQREGSIIDAFINGSKEKGRLGWNQVLNDVEAAMKQRGVDYKFDYVDRSIATNGYEPKQIIMDRATQDAFYDSLMELANKEIERHNREDKPKKPTPLLKDTTPESVKATFKGNPPSNIKIFKTLFNSPDSRMKFSADLLYSSATTRNLSMCHGDFYKLFNAQGGVNGYKTKQGTVAYMGDLLKKKWGSKATKNENIRNQSNSDFMMYTMYDQAQMYIDSSAKGYYLQAYTKVIAELKLFGLSGAKINASLIPAVHLVYGADGKFDLEATQLNAGLDKDGNLIFDGTEGIDPNEAFMLIADPEYSKSICGICIGYSDNHIWKLLDEPRVQMIIGFHDKTDDPTKRFKGAKYAHNYNGENEAVNKKTGETVHIGFAQFITKAEEMFKSKKAKKDGVDFEGNHYSYDDIPKLAADIYKKHCADNNLDPAYVKFSKHENYYKLLADIGMKNSEGKYAPHKKAAFKLPKQVPMLNADGSVTMKPTKDYIEMELEKELKVRDSISDTLSETGEGSLLNEFVKRVNDTSDQKVLSRREAEEDAKYAELAKDPKANRDKLDEMVKAAAVKAGYTSEKIYHGTTAFGFTKIDLNESDDKISFFATNTEETAATYAYGAGRRSIAKSDYNHDEIIDQKEKEFDDSVYRTISAINEMAGVYDYLDYVEEGRRLKARIQEFGESGAEWSEWEDVVYEEFAVIAEEALASQELDDDEWEKRLDAFKAEFVEDLYYAGVSLLDAWDRWYASTNGLYEMYANEDGLLVIDCKGSNWNKISVDGDIAAKYGEQITTREACKYAKKNGYTGVKFVDVKDNGGKGGSFKIKPANVYAFFNPTEQVKSADTVTYDEDGNIIPLSERFNSANDDIRYSRRDNIGYHAGDLGKSESLGQQTGRDTGHFGTGTYFVGNQEKIKGYNSRDGKSAPVEEVDFSKYNLFKPMTNSNARDLHDFLKGVNNFRFRSPDAIKSIRDYEEIKEYIDEKMYEYEESDDIAEMEILGQFKRLLGGEEVSRAFAKRYNSDEYVWIDSTGLSNSNGEVKTFDDMMSEMDYESKYDLFKDMYDLIDSRYFERDIERYERWNKDLYKAAFVLGVSEEKLQMLVDKAVNQANNFKGDEYKADSASTILMKSLGYEGVDVRHLSEFDNTTYGSVIYDLKDEDLARKQEIGTAKFSRRESEVNKDLNLIAVHGTTEEKLMRALSLEGLPGISTAVINIDDGLANKDYGNISLVFDKDTIDPRNSGNKVYGADAWSPTHSESFIERQFDERAIWKFDDRIKELSKKVAGGIFENGAHLGGIMYTGSDATSKTVEDLTYSLSSVDSVMAAYLADTGRDIEPIKKPKEYHRNFSNEALAYIIDHFKSDDLVDIYMRAEDYKMTDDDREKITSIVRDTLVNALGMKESLAEKLAPVYSEDRHTNDLLFSVLKYEEDGRPTTDEIDRLKTSDALRDEVNKDEAAFRKWIADEITNAKVFTGLEGLYNKTDRMTERGRKTFKQTHLPITAANIVKLMAKAESRGVHYHGYGVEGVQAITAEDYRSIDAIRKDKDRLKKLDDDEYSRLTSSINDEITNLVNEIADYNGSRPYMVGDAFMDAAKGSRTEASIRKAYSAAGYKISDELVKKSRKLYDKVAKIPSKYFEAKANRVVGFNEIKMAVVPDTASQKLIDSLEEHGIPYTTYKNGDEDSRLEIIRGLDNVRFSRRMQTTDVLGIQEDLQKENKMLIEEIGRLKERAKLDKQVTGGSVLNQNQVEAAARYIKKYANSAYNSKVLAKELGEIYDYINTADEIDGAYVFQRFYDLAGKVAAERKQEVEIDPYYDDILRTIRSKKVKLDSIQLQEVKNAYGENYKSALRGLVSFSDEGVSLDSLWKDLTGMYPGTFDESVTGGDQITSLIEIADAAKKAREIVKDYRDASDVTGIAYEMYDKYWSVNPVRTTADVYDKKIKQLKAEHRKAMADLKQRVETVRKDQKLADEIHFRKKLIDRIRQQEARDKAKARENLKNYKERRNENDLKRKYIASIKKDTAALAEMFNKNSKDKHIPRDLRGTVANLITAIDYSSKRLLDGGAPTKADIKLGQAIQGMQDYLAANNNAINGVQLPDSVVQDLLALKKPIDAIKISKDIEDMKNPAAYNQYILNQMTSEELAVLSRIVKTVKAEVINANKLLANRRAKTIAEVGVKTVDYLKTISRGGKYSEELEKVVNFVGWQNGTPVYVFDRFGEGGQTIFQGIVDGWCKLAYNVADALDYAEAAYTAEEAEKWENTTHTFDVLVPATEAEKKDPGYKPRYTSITMTEAQIMSMYCLAKRDQAKLHLFQGGFTVPDIKLGKKNIHHEGTVQITESELNKILSVVKNNKRMIEVADKLQAYMNDTCTKWGNEVSMARYGYEAFGEENYFPIKSFDKNLSTDATDNEASLFRLLNMSFTKAVNDKASNAVIIDSIINVFGSHASDMAKYNAMSLPALDAFKWLNYGEKEFIGDGTYSADNSVKVQMQNAFGDVAERYVTQLLKDINGVKNGDRLTGIAKLTSMAKAASVGANLRVAALQPTAFPRAMAVIEPKYLLTGLRHKSNYEEAIKYSGMAKWKSLGFYDINITRGVEEQIKHEKNVKQDIIEKSMVLAEKGDSFTWGLLWNAAKAKAQAEGLSGETMKQRAGEILNEIILRTQVVDSTITRSELMRSTTQSDKGFTAFMSEPILSLNMICGTVYDMTLEKKSTGRISNKTRQKAVTTLFAYTLTNIAAALIETGFEIERDKDEDKLKAENILKTFLTNFGQDMSLVQKAPVVKEIISMLQGYSSKNIAFQGIEGLVYMINDLKKIGSDKWNTSKFVKDVLKAFSGLSGIPAYNAWREMMAAGYNVQMLTGKEIAQWYKDLY